MTILVTGATGYIGSHFCVLALQAGYELLLTDNFSTSSPDVIAKIEAASGCQCMFMPMDVSDPISLQTVFQAGHSIDAVVHFAAAKYVAESFSNPLKYYKNNVMGSLLLLERLRAEGIKKLVFSSTASVYADHGNKPYKESMAIKPATPYGRSKFMFEQILSDYCLTCPDFAAVSLRYFNVAGALPGGMLGEVQSSQSVNILPAMIQAAAGDNSILSIYGNDYDTPDGTAIRDYVHVMDLVRGHLQSLQYLNTHKGLTVLNLGGGSGYSLLELVNTFEQQNQVKVPYQFKERRAGDLACVYACVDKAQKEIGWQINHDLNDIVRDAWRFYINTRK